jgi:hypothetical protein
MSEGSFPDALILAALQRAELHDGHGNEPGVSYATVVAHLGLVMGSATGRRLRPRFRDMEAADLITSFKRHSIIMYTATSKGKRLREAAGDVVLPESPQHRVWRKAHDDAAERIGGFHEELHTLLDEGASLLADENTDSEAWFVFGEALGRACRRIGSATYCLRERAEPGDIAADVDVSPRRWRRNTRSWD